MTIETLTALIRERRDLALRQMSTPALQKARARQQMDRLGAVIVELEHLLRCAEAPTVTIEVGPPQSPRPLEDWKDAEVTL